MRKERGDRTLSPTEGDRAYRLARIADLATQSIGDERRAVAWLTTPNAYLGRETPLQSLDTELGTTYVEQSLAAIAYGGVAQRLTVWRIMRRAYLASAYTGFGAARNVQRWNSKGVYVAYCASSMALAQLERLVHISRELAPTDLVGVSATIPDDSVEKIDTAVLPANWRDVPPPIELAAIGDDWASSNRSLVLRVPSVVSPQDDNILINPRHPRFPEIEMLARVEVTLDTRLFRD